MEGHGGSRSGGEEFEINLLQDAYQLYVSDNKQRELLKTILQGILASMSQH